MAVKYTYSIVNDFLNSEVESISLTSQIQDSDITIALDYINTSGDDCDIWFKVDLPSDATSTLNTIVAAHTGEELEEPIELRDRSGKLRVHQTSRKLGTTTYFAGAGDDMSDPTNYGGGDHFIIDHSINDSTAQVLYMDFNMVENETWIHEGYVQWKNANFDNICLEIVPRVTNCHIDSTASTYYNLYGGYLIVPAAGDGTLIIDGDITQPNAGLVRTPPDNDGVAATAYWNADWNSTTKLYENITAAPSGNGKYNMFAAEVTLIVFVKHLHMLESGFLMIQTSDADELGHGMRLRLTASTMLPDHAWKVTFLLTMHRKKTT